MAVINRRMRAAFAPTSLRPTRETDRISMRLLPAKAVILITISSVNPNQKELSVGSIRPSQEGTRQFASRDRKRPPGLCRRSAAPALRRRAVLYRSSPSFAAPPFCTATMSMKRGGFCVSIVMSWMRGAQPALLNMLAGMI